MLGTIITIILFILVFLLGYYSPDIFKMVVLKTYDFLRRTGLLKKDIKPSTLALLYDHILPIIFFAAVFYLYIL
jgi:hypothetical protein